MYKPFGRDAGWKLVVADLMRGAGNSRHYQTALGNNQDSQVHQCGGLTRSLNKYSARGSNGVCDGVNLETWRRLHVVLERNMYFWRGMIHVTGGTNDVTLVSGSSSLLRDATGNLSQRVKKGQASWCSVMFALRPNGEN